MLLHRKLRPSRWSAPGDGMRQVILSSSLTPAFCAHRGLAPPARASLQGLKNGNDDRSKIAAPNASQRAYVQVYSLFSKDLYGTCGGVLLDAYSVLTAAHCVFDNNGKLLPNDRVHVCLWGNAYDGAVCDGRVRDFFLPPSNVYGGPYTGTGFHPKKDYIILNMGAGPLPQAGASMALSNADDSFVKQFMMHNLQSPATRNVSSSTCTINETSAVDTSRGAPSAFGGNFMLHQRATIGTTANNTFKFNHDGGSGSSGSPIYYCGGETCGVGDTRFVVSIWSGWNGSTCNHVGPKAREFRAWALGVL